MIRIVTLLIFLAAVGWFFYATRPSVINLKETVKKLASTAVDAYVKCKNPSSLNISDIVKCIKVLLYCIAVICVVLLTLTGFMPYFITGGPISGFLLILHVSLSPVFAISMTLISLLWAHEQIFNTSDQQWLYNSIFGKRDKDAISHYQPVLKVCFWLLVFLTPFIMGSIILSMYTIFGTGGQESLLTLHFSSALLFLIVSLVHTYLLLSSKETGRKDP